MRTNSKRHPRERGQGQDNTKDRVLSEPTILLQIPQWFHRVSRTATGAHSVFIAVAKASSLYRTPELCLLGKGLVLFSSGGAPGYSCHTEQF